MNLKPELIGLTGYDDLKLWSSDPGFEVRVYISPVAEPLVETLATEEDMPYAKIVGGFVYGHFEFVEEDVQKALDDPHHIHTWLTHFHESLLAALLILQQDEFRWFLLHKSEAEELAARWDAGESTTDLKWVNITLKKESGMSVSRMPKE